jgi:hypothetical protein
MFSSKRSKVIAAGIAVIAIAGGGSYGIVTATSSSATTTASSSAGDHGLAGGFGAGGSGSNARSGPAAGGSVGTVGSVSASSFTLSTSTGQKVTVAEAPSTTYEQGTSPASASAVTEGAPVLVLGTRLLRGPLHRRQLAAPHLRQPGLPGHRGRLIAGPAGPPRPRVRRRWGSACADRWNPGPFGRKDFDFSNGPWFHFLATGHLEPVAAGSRRRRARFHDTLRR